MNRPAGISLRGPTTVKIKGTFQTRKASDTVQSYIQQWDWTGNIKPQMDTAVNTLGANALHISSVASAVNSGYVTQPQLLARLKQQLDYCTTVLKIAVYVGLFYSYADLAVSTNQTVGGAIAALCEQYPNVVGFDLCNEMGGTPAQIDSAMRTWLPIVRANTSLPFTASINATGSAALSGATVKALSPYVDFYDFHNYPGASGTLAPADFAALRASAYYKPWVIGESGQSRANGSTAVGARWVGNGALSNEKDCFGAFGYTLLDFVDDLGIYSTTLGVSPDTDMTTAFASWPARL